MLKFNRKFKKLVIPVGLNPNYNIDSSTLYNTSDATATANDIISGKVAYGSDGKIVGSLDINERVQESYNEGVQSQKSKLTTITITENGTYNREDGYNEVMVEVPDLNGNYDEGYSDGVFVGREEIITEQSDATISPQTVFKGEIGYGSNNERIVGEFEFVEGFDFGKIGYSQELSNEVNSDISDDIAYSKQLYDAWDPNRTSAQGYFNGNKSLVYVPLFNTSNVTDMNNMFYTCSNLTSVPEFDTSNVTNMSYMFFNCSILTLVSHFDTSNVTNMSYMFFGCSNLTSVPEFDTSNVTNMNNMFYNCSNLTSVPEFDTSKVANMNNMFFSCIKLTSVPEFDTSNVTNMSYMFYNCSNVVSIGLLDMSSATEVYNTFANCGKLENIASVTNCGKGFTGTSSSHTLSFSYSSKLTKQSCLNIFNTIYDMTQTSVTDAKITLHATTKALLSPEDIAIATNKGWTIS